jgi:TolB protein
MPAGPLRKDVVVEFLAHDSSHGPAEAGHVFAVDDAHREYHSNRAKIKECTEVGCIRKASTSA